MALKIHTEQYGPTLIDRGNGNERVTWRAWREGRPRIFGYGTSEEMAIRDLKYTVQPDWTGELDGEGTPTGALVGGNMFHPEEVVRRNSECF